MTGDAVSVTLGYAAAHIGVGAAIITGFDQIVEASQTRAMPD